MRILPPLITTGDFGILAAMLTSSAAAEPGTGEVAWVTATPYAVGATVYLASTHLRYESRTAHTSGAGNMPSLATMDEPSTDWQVLTPTNRYAMFDALRSTGTTIASGSSVVVTPGVRQNAIGFAGLSNVATIDIVMTRGAVVVYTVTVALSTRLTGGSFYRWFFTPFSYKTEFALWDLPPYTDAVITITPHSASGTGNCVIGDCVIGMQEYIGTTLAEPDDDAISFTSVNRKFDGSATVTRRRMVPKNTIQVLVDKLDLDRVRDVRERLDGVPAIYSAVEDKNHGYFSAFFRKGVHQRWSHVPKTQSHAIASMEIEEI